ncbi:MAG TPA: ABC transporter substrate-binding protein [Desulfobacteraceae bacterium]|nr:ABC transporter substrate-binding protein [Desulfobacteraceae bacterium]HPJ67169.1 ABC transporter substrate-binding protein [Desulfobacteraceae bacterium]HPQ29325.1 ABC transporter substrate-binding protein [Desulfobacteraceae bacterium]
MSFFLITFLGIGTVIAGDKTPGVTKDEIKIGCISPLTGQIAMVGTAIAEGARDYYNYINEKGGINGRKIKFIAEDGKYEPPTAMACLKKLIAKDKIFVLSSSSGTPITAALTASIEREKLPSFATISAASIFYPKPPSHLFSFGPYYSENMIFNIEYILFNLKEKSPKIAFFYQDDEFGIEGLTGFKKAADKYNLNVVAIEKYGRGSIDISSQVHKLKAAKPDYILASTVPSTSILLLKEARKVGLNIPIIALNNTRFEQVIKVAGDAAANFYTGEYTALPGDECPGMKRLMEIWYKNNPPDTLPARYYILSQVCAMIIVEGIEMCGDDLTRENFVRQVESIKNFDTGGITGKISYSKNDHCPLSEMCLVRANPKTNRYETISDWGLNRLKMRNN